jgi:hypothetical protein
MKYKLTRCEVASVCPSCILSYIGTEGGFCLKCKNQKLWKEYLKSCQVKIASKCTECERQLPNKNWKTKNGCIYCDVKYWRKK